MEEKQKKTQLDKLIDTGIPVVRAEFKLAVNNSDNVPENFFDLRSEKTSRRVDMWWTAAGLICEHKKKYFLVPTDNVKFANLK